MALPAGKTKKIPGRPPERQNKSTQELRQLIESVCGNPLVGMASLAAGDVVALGYMTKRELNEPPTFDARGRVVRVSGIERALQYVPPELRAKMFCELSQYLYPKRRQLIVTDEEGKAVPGTGLVLYMPHNEREEPAPRVLVRKKPEKVAK